MAEDRGGVCYVHHLGMTTAGECLGLCRAEAKGTMCGRAANLAAGCDLKYHLT